jgi:1-acyl-sn-glycerol-3-phosphate acyltransferase
MRDVSFLIAESSLTKPVVGYLAKKIKSIPVKRPQDYILVGVGLVSTSLSGNNIDGEGCQFIAQIPPGSTITVKSVDYLVVQVLSDN